MTKELGLNEGQKAKVESIFNEQKKELKAMHEEIRTRLQGIFIRKNK